MQVESLTAATTARLATLPPSASLQMAARALTEPFIGIVIVLGPAQTIVGVVTKSDLIRHLGTADRANVTLVAVMQEDVVTCRPSDDLQSVWEMMARRELQNLPVIRADGIPIGVLDIRDALKALLELEVFTEQQLTRYVSGVGYR